MHALRELPGWSHAGAQDIELANLAAMRRASPQLACLPISIPDRPPNREQRSSTAAPHRFPPPWSIEKQEDNPLVCEDDPGRGSMGRDIHRKNVERLERALKDAVDESKRMLKLLEEKRAYTAADLLHLTQRNNLRENS